MYSIQCDVIKFVGDFRSAGQCFSPVSPTNKTDHYECATDGRICLECDLVLTLKYSDHLQLAEDYVTVEVYLQQDID
jgi:hypothetical protein